MGYPVYCGEFHTPSGYISSGDAAGFPASDVFLLTRPKEPWKGDGTPAIQNAYVGIDLGSAKAVEYLAVDHINVDSVYLQGNENSAFSGLGYSYGPLPVGQDPIDGRYKICYRVNATYQYHRVLADSTTTTDGGSVLKVGALGATKTPYTLTAPFGRPFNVTPHKRTLGIGTGTPVGMGEVFARITLNSANYGTETSMRADILRLLRYGEGAPILIFLNDGNSYEMYFCHRTGSVEVSRPGPRHHRFSQLQFRQCGEEEG